MSEAKPDAVLVDVRLGEAGRAGAGTGRVLLISNMWPTRRRPMFGIFVARHVEALRKAGAEVAVVAPRRFARMPVPLRYLLLTLAAVAEVLRRRPSVIVAHYAYPTALIGLVAARSARRPLVLVIHGTDVQSVLRRDPVASLCRRALRSADAVVAVSAALLDEARRSSLFASPQLTAVVNMGVDTGVFKPVPDARQRLGLDAGTRIVAFAGNLVPTKGVDVLIDAFGRLAEEGHADVLVIIGSGPEREALEIQADSTVRGSFGGSVRESIRFVDPVPAEVLAAWFSAADVVVLPSRREGLGLVLLEAMACGTPCVGTRVGGIPEIISHDEVGVLVDPDAPEQLAQAIAQVLARSKDGCTDACIRRARAESCDAKAREMLAVILAVERAATADGDLDSAAG
ncbi:MAG: glycosyltransferase [Coriobacteriia bacterium]|nr:glycosyltransferase [Coriobacteriia bacterium]